jgi:Lrp/AsnC family transcriptional regulator for asnA, asnC and gidA
MKENELDFINQEIIRYLSGDARLPFSELAKKLKISNSLVHQRVRKLQDLGVITGFSVDIDSKKLGYETHTYTGIVTKEARFAYTIAEALKEIPNVVECHLVSGKYALFIKIVAQNNDELRKILYEHIHTIEGVGSTDSFISFGQVFERNLEVK